MANPDWGTKRICQSCATKFYDMQREPIVCPKCGTQYDPEAFLKTRRARPIAAEKDISPSAAADDTDRDVEEVEVEDEADILDDAVVDEDAADEEDEDMIEDASELGEDDDDMAEVIENVDDEEER